MMDYRALRKLRDQLIEKENKTGEELQLLRELQSLNSLLDKTDFSLSMSGKVCKACGRPL